MSKMPMALKLASNHFWEIFWLISNLELNILEMWNFLLKILLAPTITPVRWILASHNTPSYVNVTEIYKSTLIVIKIDRQNEIRFAFISWTCLICPCNVIGNTSKNRNSEMTLVNIERADWFEPCDTNRYAFWFSLLGIVFAIHRGPRAS